MYYFPNLDEQTRLIMISELESDLKTGLFYKPRSLTSTGMFKYKRLLKECFSTGTLETLQQKLSQSDFREKDNRGIEKFRLMFKKFLHLMISTATTSELC